MAGRDAELKAISLLLGRLQMGRGERALVLTGLRGVGKTALLWAAEKRAEEQDWVVADLEARSDLDFGAALADRAWLVLRHLENRGAMREALARIASMIRRISLRDPGSGVEVAVDMAGGAGARSFEADLVELFRALGETAQQAGTGVLFLLDELQQVEAPGLEALCAAMHDLSKRDLPLTAVIAGLPSLRQRLLAAKTYAERLFNYREVGALSEKAASAALTEPALETADGLRIEPDALAALLDACEGYPYFIQVYGHVAWDVAAGPALSLAEAREALWRGRRELDADLYRGRWERASHRQREYMREMARLGLGPVGSGSAAAPLGGHRAVAVVREQLIANGLIYSPRRGQVAFTVPGFSDYIRRRGLEAEGA